MMHKIIFSLLLMLSMSAYGQQKETYSKTELDAKLELQEHKLDAKLNELELKEDNLELSKQNVADIISFHKEGVEDFHRTLNYILVIVSIIITIAIAAGGYLLGRYNKRKSNELKKDIDALRSSMEKSLEAIKEEANRELNLIRAEAKKQLAQMEHNTNESKQNS